jgi:uncharacterized protein with HEPN domain
MSNKDDLVYIKHIIDAIDKVESWTDGASLDDFSDDSGLLQSSVVRQLEIIGEATNKVSEEFKESYPEIPWRNIIGMRNRLIHEYMSIDIELTWGVVQQELPKLRQLLIRINN